MMEPDLKTLQLMIEQSDNFIGLLSSEGLVLYANRSALEFLETSKDDVQGKKLWDCISVLDDYGKHSIKQAFSNALADGKARFAGVHRKKKR